jgi:hypothetical protein
MVDHNPGDVVGILGNKIQLRVTTDHAEQPNSYRTITTPGPSSDRTGATVTMEAGKTFFRYDGDVFLFDGVSYRPNSDYRDDDGFGDGEVALVYPDGIHPDEGHPLNPLNGWFTMDDFVEMLVSGELDPAPNPHENGN